MPVQLERDKYSAAYLVEELLIKSSDRRMLGNNLMPGAPWREYELSITVFTEHRTSCMEFDAKGEGASDQQATYRFPVLVWPHEANGSAGRLDENVIDFADEQLREFDRISIDFQWSRPSNQQFLRISGVPAALTA